MNPPASTSVPETDAKSLAQALKSAHPPTVVDVREGWEVQKGALPQAVHVPLATLAPTSQGLPEDKDRAIVTYCHHGVRSMRAAVLLQGLGYTHVSSLRGGIDAWATDVDGAVGRY